MPQKAPLPYQLDKLEKMDADNALELEAIKAIVEAAKVPGAPRPTLEQRTKIAQRVRRLEKSVKAAARYCREIGYVRPPKSSHENGDGV